MKGLLIKDYYILWSQKRTFLIFLFIALMFLIGNDDPAGAVSYCLFITTFLSLTTISYDDHENGLAFLMTLPPGRKTYVTAKYVFCLINSVTAWFVLILLGCALVSSKNSTDFLTLFTEMFLLLLSCIIVSSLLMPLHLKYGAEKTRFVLLGCLGFIIGLGLILSKMGAPFGDLLDSVTGISLPAAGITLTLAAVLIYAASYVIALKVVEGKEF